MVHSVSRLKIFFMTCCCHSPIEFLDMLEAKPGSEETCIHLFHPLFNFSVVWTLSFVEV